MLNRSYQVHSAAQTNAYVESFHGKLRGELLNQELFLSLAEAQYMADRWRLDYNHHRPHSSLGWRTPAAFAAACVGPRGPRAGLSLDLVHKTGEGQDRARPRG